MKDLIKKAFRRADKKSGDSVSTPKSDSDLSEVHTFMEEYSIEGVDAHISEVVSELMIAGFEGGVEGIRTKAQQLVSDLQHSAPEFTGLLPAVHGARSTLRHSLSSSRPSGSDEQWFVGYDQDTGEKVFSGPNPYLDEPVTREVDTLPESEVSPQLVTTQPMASLSSYPRVGMILSKFRNAIFDTLSTVKNEITVKIEERRRGSGIPKLPPQVSTAIRQRPSKLEITRRIVLSSTFFVALSAVPVSIFSFVRGGEVAKYGLRESQQKLAIRVKDSEKETIGFVYGAMIGRSNVAGIDSSIPVPPEYLEEGGPLYIAYRALIDLEDQGHDGGLTDWIGVNPFYLARGMAGEVLKKLPFIKGNPWGGGSSLADQACGQMQSGLPYYNNPELIYKKFRGRHPYVVKFNDTACGFYLALTQTPEEIAAQYMNFGYVAPGANGFGKMLAAYYNIHSFQDPSFHVGHQIVLPTMLNRTWRSTDDSWELIRRRSYYAAKHLIEDGIIEEMIDGRSVYEYIDDARPKAYVEVNNQRDGFSLQPRYGYDYPVARVIEELEKRFGENFKYNIESVETTIDGWVQGALVRSAREELVEMSNPDARALGYVVDHQGRVVAAFSGSLSTDVYEGDIAVYDHIDLINSSPHSMGSLGKLFVAAGAAKKGYRVEDQGGGFLDSLAMSRSEIIDHAKLLQIDSGYVAQLLGCYGQRNKINLERRDSDPIREAALGMFGTNPDTILPLLFAARTGRALPERRYIDKVFLRDGSIIEIEPAEISSTDEWCAENVYNDSTSAWDWFSVPIEHRRGTLRKLQGVADAGKTGTVGEKANRSQGILGSTNSAWVLTGMERADSENGEMFSAVFGIRRAGELCELGSNPCKIINLDRSLAGGNRPAEIAKDTLKVVKQRDQEGELE